MKKYEMKPNQSFRLNGKRYTSENCPDWVAEKMIAQNGAALGRMFFVRKEWIENQKKTENEQKTKKDSGVPKQVSKKVQ